MTADRMSVELNLAAALALLSSAALGGVTPAKARALRLHLSAISAADGITADVLARWETAVAIASSHSAADRPTLPALPTQPAPEILH